MSFLAENLTDDEGEDSNFVTKTHPFPYKIRNFTKKSIMNFRTQVNIPKYNFEVNHNNTCIFTGSCFAENVGKKIEEFKIPSLVNPLGIHYNPLSLANSINLAIDNKKLSEDDLFFANGLWNSYDYHSSFSQTDKSETVSQINNSISEYHSFLKSANFLFITFGTSYIYELAENSKLVTNCHKQPEKTFSRRLLEVSEIVNIWRDLIAKLKDVNPNLQIIFTLSPVRHLRDGASNNQISKSTLLLAIHKLIEAKDLTYFPSFEIMNDELRDYRFYAEDMIHPSDTAVKYLMEKFSEAFFSDKTQNLNKRVQKIINASSHRPFNTDTANHKSHCKKMLSEINEIMSEFPNLDFNQEILRFQN